MKKIIIIGAGTSGSVICSKLSEYYDVTVFDSSTEKKLPIINRIPLLVGLLYNSKNKYINKILINFNNKRELPFFVSNVLGGSSVINGCVHVIGIDSKWRSLLEKFEITYDSYLRSCTDLYTWRNIKRKLNLKEARQSTLDNAFNQSLSNLGVNIAKTDRMDNESCGPTINTVGKVLRSSIADLNPYEKSKVLLNSKVTNLIVDDHGNVIGVVADGKNYFSDYVILSAGVLGTNEILLRPQLKIGDNNLIKSKINSGSGIKDHVNLRINVEAKSAIECLNSINKSLYKKILLGIKHFLQIKTLMNGTGATSSANLDIDNDDLIDTRVNLLNFSENGRLGSEGEIFKDKYGFSLSITPINPTSKGRIYLDHNEEIKLELNYANEIADREGLKKALNYCVKLLDTDPLKKYVLNIDLMDMIHNEVDKYIDENIYSGYHLIGGCQNVINKNFEVNGLVNLFVCDASILDEYVSSNIHSTVLILADLFARKFLNLKKGELNHDRF
jgi:choline dehydrogenase-like flavoprotein